MTSFSDQFPLPHVSITDTRSNVVVAEFYGSLAERRARDLAAEFADAVEDIERFDVSVSDDHCPSCLVTFWHEAPNRGDGAWRCPACNAPLPEKGPA